MSTPKLKSYLQPISESINWIEFDAFANVSGGKCILENQTLNDLSLYNLTQSKRIKRVKWGFSGYWEEKRKRYRDRHKRTNEHMHGWGNWWLNHHFCPPLFSFFPLAMWETLPSPVLCVPLVYTALCSCRTLSTAQMSWCTTLRGCILF